MRDLVIFTVVFSMLRFVIPTYTPAYVGIYAALAHVYVGVLFGAWFADKKNSSFLVCGIILTIVEIVAFLMHKGVL